MKAFSRYVFCIVAVMCACCEGAPLFAGGFSTPYWYGVGERMFAGSSFLGSRNAFGKSVATESDKPLVASQAEFYAVKSAYENGDADAMAMLERYIAESVEKVGIPSANSMLADLYMKAGRFADAAKIYASADISTLSREERALMTLNSAIIEYEKGNFGEVKALLSDFPKPGVPYGNEALFYKSAACYALGEYDEAEQGFDRLSHDGRFADASRHYLTGIYFADKRFGRALESGEALLASPAEDKAGREELLRICGESAFYLGDREKCVSYLEAYVGETASPLPEALYMLGVSYYSDARYRDAVSMLGRVACDDAELMQSASLYLGHSYLAEGDKDGALLAYGNAANSGSDMSVREAALYNYALLLNETSIVSFSKAVATFESYVNMFPNSKNAGVINRLLVNRYFTADNYQEALASIANIENPSDVILKARQEILYRMGSQAYVNGDADVAYSCFSQAADMGNLSADILGKALLWRGEIAYAKGDYAAAYDDFSRALQASRSVVPVVYYNLGYTGFSKGEYGKAAQMFSKYLSEGDGKGKMAADAWCRIGDCRYMASDYTGASAAYVKGGELWPEGADYAVFRQGVIAQVQKRPDAVVAFMERLREQYPSSRHIPDALYLEGMGLLASGKSSEGIARLSSLVSKYPSSDAARAASLQRAVAYVNAGDMPKALEAYKQVVALYPRSEEARIAEADLKNLYVQSGNVDEYLAYLNDYKSGEGYDVAEIDSLTFFAAENLFLKSGKDGFARIADYLESYPDGAFVADAAYYAGRYMYDAGDTARCRSFLSKGIAAKAKGRFAAESLYLLASVEESAGNNAAAEKYYRKVSESFPDWEGEVDARCGLVRTAYASGRFDVAVSEASMLLNSSLPAGEASRILYLRASAYSRLGESEAAHADLVKLAADKRSVYGAEAAYRLGEDCLVNNDTDGAAAYASELISSGTGQRYWVARAIILLSDVSYRKGDRYKAVQYLKSLSENYDEDDDIKGIIEKKLLLYSD